MNRDTSLYDEKRGKSVTSILSVFILVSFNFQKNTLGSSGFSMLKVIGAI